MKLLKLACFAVTTSLCAGAHAVSSAEFYTSQSYQYGRFEARIQFAPGDGVISSFFLWKNGSEVAGTFWNELDFEKLGADCHLQTNAIYGNPSVPHSQTPTLSSSLCDQFHTYAYEWTPDYISWLVDGVEIRRENGDTATAFAQNATAGMQFRFNVWPGDASFGGNFDPGILPVYQYIHWVRYSSYSNGAFEPKWSLDFTAGTMPSGWLAGNWASPKGLSTHAPGNIGFVDGFAVLALTADNALGVVGATPEDTVDGGLPGTGGSTSSPDAGNAAAAGSGQNVAGSSNAVTTAGGGGGCGCRLAAAPSKREYAAVTLLGLLVGGAGYRRRSRCTRNEKH
jgi:endo-1,3-1,4-beta-glycanase ExoK